MVERGSSSTLYIPPSFVYHEYESLWTEKGYPDACSIGLMIHGSAAEYSTLNDSSIVVSPDLTHQANIDELSITAFYTASQFESVVPANQDVTTSVNVVMDDDFFTSLASTTANALPEVTEEFDALNFEGENGERFYTGHIVVLLILLVIVLLCVCICQRCCCSKRVEEAESDVDAEKDVEMDAMPQLEVFDHRKSVASS